MLRLLPEEGQYVQGFAPVDMSAGVNAGDWVGMEDHRSLDVVLVTAVGTAGQDPVLTLLQAQDAAGTGSKALALSTYYKKQGATALSGVGAFTKATATTPGTFGGADEASSAENQTLWVIPVQATDLDLANGFTHVSASVADVGAAAQLGMLLYVLYGARQKKHPQPSVID